MTSPPRNVPRRDVMERFDLSSSGLYKLTRDGRFPEPFNVGGKVLWRESDLVAVESGTWSPHPKPAPPVVDDEDPFDERPAAAPAPVKRPRGRPPGSKSKARPAAPAPVLARSTLAPLPAHLGNPFGPGPLDSLRGAR